jgi:hypothetical protein
MIRRLLLAADIFLALLHAELLLHRARRDRLRARVAELERRAATFRHNPGVPGEKRESR